MKFIQFLKSKKTIALACFIVVIGLILSAGVLIGKGYAQEENPHKTLNDDRSLVYVTGDNYSLDKEKEQEYLEREKQKQENFQKEPEETSIYEHLFENTQKPSKKPAEQSNSGGTPGGSGNNPGEHAGGEGEKTKQPVIICSLTNNQQVSGEYITFTVEAKDYKNNHLNSYYLTVTLNGNKLISSGTTNNVITYRNSDPLNEGINEITIKAVDEEGNTAVKTYIINANTQGEREEGGVVSIRIEAETLGLGTLAQNNSMPFYEGESVAFVVDRFLKESGIPYDHSGTFTSSFYLKRIYMPGITNGYKIPPKLLNKLDEENTSIVGFEADSLGQKDFYAGSGWMYMLNGAVTDGMSTKTVYDGDEIHLGFTLNMIKEYNGEWFYYGEW